MAIASPQRAQAVFSGVPISCSAWRWGLQGYSDVSLQAASRLLAGGGRLGQPRRPMLLWGIADHNQSPLANRDGDPPP